MRLILEAQYLTNRFSRGRTKTIVEKKDYKKDFPELKNSRLWIVKPHRVSRGSLWTAIQVCLWIKMRLVLPKVVQ